MSTEFKPWRTDWIFGAILSAIGAASGTLATVRTPSLVSLKTHFWCVAVVFLLAGYWYLRRGSVRVYGVYIERQAVKKLSKQLVEGWELQSNVKVSAGDLDALLVGPGERRYAIEIKSQSAIRIEKGGLWGGKDKLLDRHGEALGRKPFVQAIRNAQDVGALPVLWYPRAKQHEVARNIKEVLVVCGTPNQLLRALDVPRRSWF